MLDNTVAGLKRAITITENRRRTAIAANYVKEYIAAYDDLLISLRAELWRAENPEEAKKTVTYLD